MVKMGRDLSRTYFVCRICNGVSFLGVENYRQHRLEIHNSPITGTLLNIIEEGKKKQVTNGKSGGDQVVLVEEVVTASRLGKRIIEEEGSTKGKAEGEVKESDMEKPKKIIRQDNRNVDKLFTSVEICNKIPVATEQSIEETLVKRDTAGTFKGSGISGKVDDANCSAVGATLRLDYIRPTAKTQLGNHIARVSAIIEDNCKSNGSDEWVVTKDICLMTASWIVTEDPKQKMKSKRRTKRKLEYILKTPFGKVAARDIKRPRIHTVKKPKKKHHVEVPITDNATSEFKRQTTELSRLGVTDSSLLDMVLKPAGRHLREKRKLDWRDSELEEPTKSVASEITRRRKPRRRARRVTEACNRVQQFQCPTCLLQFICDEHLRYHIAKFHSSRMSPASFQYQRSIDMSSQVSADENSQVSLVQVSNVPVEKISQETVDEPSRMVTGNSRDNVSQREQGSLHSSGEAVGPCDKDPYINRNWNPYLDNVVKCKTCNRLLASMIDFHIHYARNHATSSLPKTNNREIITN